MLFSAVWSGSTVFAILSSLIRVLTICHSESDCGLHFLSTSAVWSVSTQFAIRSKQYFQGLHCLPFPAVWSDSTLFANLSSLIRVYTICHCQSDQGLDCMPLSVCSGSILFLSSLIKVYTTCHSRQTDQGQGLHCHSQKQPDQDLHYMPFSAVWSGSTLFTILSILIWVYSICHYQTNQGLHCLPFSAVWSTSRLFAILSSLIRIYTICHSQQSDQGLHYLPFFLSSIMKVYTVCHSQQSNQGLHYLSISTVWSGSTLFPILSSLIRVYTICHSF